MAHFELCCGSTRRVLTFILTFSLLIVLWTQWQTRPPHRVYEQFYERERQSSLAFLKSANESRYVKFKQLHNIGFNNQVR